MKNDNISFSTVKAKRIFKNVANKEHNGELEVLSATQDKGVIPRSQVDIDIKYDESSLSSYKKVEKGNFVISLRSFQGGIEYSEYKGIVSPAYTIIEPQLPICDGYYKQYFKSSYFINKLQVAVYGIRDGKQISYNDFGIMDIHYPPLEEQQKIAEILSTQDKVIELKEKMIAEKQRQKKYLMQQLLTGKIQVNVYKDLKSNYTNKNVYNNLKIEQLCKKTRIGYIPKHWDLLPLRELVAFLDHLRKPVKENERVSGIYPYYGMSGIIDYVNDYIFDGEYILLGEDGANILTRTFPLAFKVSGKIWVNNHAHVILPKKSINIDFLVNVLESKNYEKYNSGTAQPKLNREVCENLLIQVPPIEEQCKIAEILSTADKEIDLLQKELKQEKQKKKALMQLLLTGIVRV